MNKCFRLLYVLLLVAVPCTAFSQSGTPSAPEVAAKGFLLIDFNSGKVLASKAPNEKLDPASITKLMTAYAIFKAIEANQISLDDEVLVSEKAWRTKGSRMFIEAGKKVVVKDLLQGMIVQSGNDASVALAEFAAGTEETFAQVMNQQAADLRMINTHYQNSTGLPAEDHYTSAADIAKLASALIREFPDYYRWYSQKQFTFNGITQGNRNALLWRDDSVDGMKTGYTENAGYCLVASAERNGMRLISVVLGTKSPAARAKESQALLNYGFRFYETHSLWQTDAAVASARVWKGAVEATELVVRNPVFVTFPRGSRERLKLETTVDELITAPFDTDTRLGQVKATLDGETIARGDLYSTAAVTEGGFIDSAWDELLMWFE
jgi:D-alanyl-D-alanine carboxypeptidase (penicillin-binding protein 5/6)